MFEACDTSVVTKIAQISIFNGIFHDFKGAVCEKLVEKVKKMCLFLRTLNY